jgi:hypothetical protein
VHALPPRASDSTLGRQSLYGSNYSPNMSSQTFSEHVV